MRSALSLAAGISVSAAGLLTAVLSAHDLAGALLIGAGVVVALLGSRRGPMQGEAERR